MKRIYLFLLLLCALAPVGRSEGLFQYALVPDTISTLTGRCNYLAQHFWDHADIPALMSRRQAVAGELEVYLNIIINADRPVAQAGITAMLKQLEKRPDDLVFMVGQGERLLYSDSAVTWVDDLYMPFLEAVTSNKKVDKPLKARFEYQKNILQNSLVGTKAGSLPITLPDDTQANLDDYNAQALVVMFYDPECDDCHLARMRLNGDIATSQLIDKGITKIVAISVTEPDDGWKEEATTWPQGWTVAASDQADITFDMRGGSPVFYVLDRNHIIRFKNLQVEQVLDIMQQLSNH